MPTAAHFIYIPAVLILGIVIGWILGSRAAADALMAQLRKITAKSDKTDLKPKAKPEAESPETYRPTDSRFARISGNPALMIFICALVTSHPIRIVTTVGASVSTMPYPARGSPSRGWPTAPQFTR